MVMRGPKWSKNHEGFVSWNLSLENFKNYLSLLQPQIWSSKSKSQINRQSLFVFLAKNPRFWRAYKIFRYYPRFKHLIAKRIKMKIWTQNFFVFVLQNNRRSLNLVFWVILYDSYLYKIALWCQGIDLRILMKSKWLDF